MMILKLTENGGFRLLEATDIHFSRAPEPSVTFKRDPGSAEERITLVGDAFVLDEGGNTLDKFFIQPRQEGRNHR